MGSSTSSTNETTSQLADVAAKKDYAKQKLISIFVDKSSTWRSKTYKKIGNYIKAIALEDPDMWPCVQSQMRTILDNLWSDIEGEIERSIQMSITEQREDVEAEGPSGCCLPFYRIRAFLLYHYFPHDRSVFGKIKDPVYLLIYGAMLVPIHGLRVIIYAILLLFLLLPAPPDECMLITFITNAKGMQFMTSGLLYLIYGATNYFMCYSFQKDSLLECMDIFGPGTLGSGGQLLDYAGTTLIVWVAFLALPCSKNSVNEFRRKRCDSGEHEDELLDYQGGRLRSLLKYDMVCFSISIMLFVFLTVVTCDVSDLRMLSSNQFNANSFWCCVLYSLLSFPFFIFCLPGLNWILTHSDQTGYNRKGACVPFILRTLVQDNGNPFVEEAEEGPMQLPGFDVRPIVKVVEALDRGKLLRGGSRYKFQDVVTGWLDLRAQKVRRSSLDSLTLAAKQQEPENCSDSNFSSDAAESRLLGTLKQKLPESSNLPHTGMQRHSRRSQKKRLTDGILARLSKEEFTMDLRIDSVRIVRAIATGDRTSFIMEVTPRGRDAWHVRRRYGDYRSLAKKLGPFCWELASAPFPEQRPVMRKMRHQAWTEADLEERRRGLESWFNRVLQEWDALGDGVHHIRDFVVDELDQVHTSDEDSEAPDLQSAGAIRHAQTRQFKNAFLENKKRKKTKKLWKAFNQYSCCSAAADALLDEQGEEFIEDHHQTVFSRF